MRPSIEAPGPQRIQAVSERLVPGIDSPPSRSCVGNTDPCLGVVWFFVVLARPFYHGSPGLSIGYSLPRIPRETPPEMPGSPPQLDLGVQQTGRALPRIVFA